MVSGWENYSHHDKLVIQHNTQWYGGLNHYFTLPYVRKHN